MVTTASNNFEGGTDGVVVSPANSGAASGTAFDVQYGTGFVYSAADATQGTMGAAVAANAFGAAVWNISSTKASAHMKYSPKAIPTSGDCYLMRFHNAGGTRLFDVHMQGTGRLRVFDATGANVWTAGAAHTAAGKYRLEAYVVGGSTTSNGTIKVAYYLGNSTTPIETFTAAGTANVGTGETFKAVYLGKYNNAPEAYGFDEFAVDTTLSDFIGIPTASPPTVSTPANQNVAAGAAVSTSVTASSSSGTIASYAWSVIYSSATTPTLTGATTNTAGFTAGAAGNLYILQCVVTDSNSQTTTVTTEVRVPTSGDFTVLPGSLDATTGTWSSVGGAATPGDALADNSDTTYLESTSLSATALSFTKRFQPLSARSSWQTTVKLAEDTTGAATVVARLYEGATLRQTWTFTPTTSPAGYVCTLTTPGAITDWGNLFFKVDTTAP